MNKKNLLYLVVVLMLFGFQSDKPIITKWVITSGCSLQVNGSTNINKFTCVIASYNRPDTIVTSRVAGQPVKLSGNIQLDVQQFDCHNAIMTADLRKTLKSKEHPKLMIFFASMNQYPEPGKWGLKGSVLIVLAGVSRNYDVDYRLVSLEPGMITLEGTRKVNFSDFNLTPPRKLGGMIKTNNELTVVFTLRMRVLPS